MSGFRAIYVPLIALIPWILYPLLWYFLSIKPMKEDWTEQFEARNTSRQVYGSGTDFRGNWPEGEPDGPKEQQGAEDKQQDQQAYEATQARLAEEKAAAEVRRGAHQAELDALLNRFMVGINQNELDYESPDKFLYELLDTQRDEAGPRLVQFLGRAYPDLYFDFDPSVPAPPINLTQNNLPQPGPQGRLGWPLGKEDIGMIVYGPYDALLNFVDTFPERYDRIAQITAFDLERVAFDYRGTVLMQLTTNIRLFVWPTNATAAAPQAAPGMGMEPGMEGMPPEAPPMEGAPPGEDAPPPADPGGGGDE